MRAIFISYRRDDTEGQAGRLFDDLKQHFGEGAVFMDVAGLEAGRDFRRAIDDQVASCGVLLAIIGKNWLMASDGAGARRLDDPMDFVRLETASALKRDIPVVPVLVQGARMPRAEDLPDNLKELSFRNGVELTHARWDSDVQVLIKALRPFVQVSQPVPGVGPSLPPTASRRARVPVVIGLAIAVLAAAVTGYAWYRNSHDNEGDQDQGAAIVTPGADAGAAATDPVVTLPKANAEQRPEAQTLLTFRDWEGTWDLEWEFQGTRYKRVMSVSAEADGITGDYVNGTLEGGFVDGDVARVSGEITNTTNTGTTCTSGDQAGKQAGVFSLALSRDGRSMDGWWDVCGEGQKWPWKARKQ
jgi:hypothetical protein